MISTSELENLFDRVACLEYQNHHYQFLFSRIATLERINTGPRVEALETFKTNNLEPLNSKTEMNRIDIESLQRSMAATYRLVLLDNERFETWKQSFDAGIAKLRDELKEIRVSRNTWRRFRRDQVCVATA